MVSCSMSTLNETLQDKASKILEFLDTSATKATDFASTNIPLYIQELLRWKFWENAIWALLAISIIASFILVAKKYFKIHKECSEAEDVIHISYLIISGTVSVPMLFELIKDISQMIEICVAPRVWLVEYASTILKTLK